MRARGAVEASPPGTPTVKHLREAPAASTSLATPQGQHIDVPVYRRDPNADATGWASSIDPTLNLPLPEPAHDPDCSALHGAPCDCFYEFGGECFI